MKNPFYAPYIVTMIYIFTPILVALLISAFFAATSIFLAKRFGIMDAPDARKVHTTPTPRLGGIAIFVGATIAILCMQFFAPVGSHTIPLKQFIGILGGSLFVFLVGLVDDIRTVSSRFKLAALITASLMVCGSGATIDRVSLGGHLMLQFTSLSWIVTTLWICGIAVAINFIDGLDGLAGGIVLLASSVLAMFLIQAGLLSMAVLPLALSGAVIGFLLFNWYPAKTFMGDSGSMTISFMIASYLVVANPIIGTMRGFLIPSLALSIPILDTLNTVFRRHYEQRRSLFSAERGHIHHRLLDRGLTHQQAVLVLLGVSALAVLIGVISLSFVGWSTIGGLVLLAPLMWGTFRLAGSVRTDNMLTALRNKRFIDKESRRYRSHFESLQLEFHRFKTLSQWWDGVCAAGDKLGFVQIELKLPRTNERTHNLVWQSAILAGLDESGIKATIPVAAPDDEAKACCIHIHVASLGSLESASERLSLFSRLLSENSLIAINKREARALAKKGPISQAALRNVGTSMSVDQLSNSKFAGIRVAVVHDFLYTIGGAERVIEQIINAFPHCDLFALFDFLPENQRDFLKNKHVTTSFIQNLPFARSKHRGYLGLMPLAIEQLDVSNYDLVISSSYLAAKGVITGPEQLHVCYCHSPVRYAWDLQHQYLAQAKLGFGIRGMIARTILHYIRMWDLRSALGVDHFIANSGFVANRIDKMYRRKATIIHPPVDTEQFQCCEAKEDFYIVAGRMVPYKRTDLIVRAFSQTPNRRLVVIGDGPDMGKVRAIAGPNVEFLGFQDNANLADYIRRAKALIFAAEEDFGIVPVEAMACGTPVIAFGKGGVTESVVNGKHGVFYDSQTEESLLEALDIFESQADFGKFVPSELRRRSMEFSSTRFIFELTTSVEKWLQEKWPERFETVAAESSKDPTTSKDEVLGSLQ